MSFSSEVKKEIFAFSGDRHCRIAELSAIINTCGKISVLANGNIKIKVKTENQYVAGKLCKYWENDFQVKCNIDLEGTQLSKTSFISLEGADMQESIKKILWTTGIMDRQSGTISKRIDPLVVKSECCKRSYLRGAFLGGGSISDPVKTYHMEFTANDLPYNKELTKLFTYYELRPKNVNRKGNDLIYFKEAEQISTILNIINAHVAMMEFENCRVDKDMANSINRVSNCMAANEDKLISASVKHVTDIIYIDNMIGLASLPDNLYEVATVRLENRIISLQEIGKKLNPPIGKSGVNHRLRKISEIAESLKKADTQN